MSSDVHSDVLNPLQKVVDIAADHKEQLAKVTGEELVALTEELDAEMIRVFNEMIADTEKNIKEYAQLLNDPGIVDRNKIEETELYEMLIAALAIVGKTTPEDVTFFLNKLGLKPATDLDEFVELDDNDELDQGEMPQSTYDETVTGDIPLNKQIQSVFLEYSDQIRAYTPPIESFEDLKNFLSGKILIALVALSDKYTPKESTMEKGAFTGASQSESPLGGIADLFMSEGTESELGKFYNALLVGGAVDESKFFDKSGKYNETFARIAMETQIANIFEETNISTTAFESYKSLLNPPKWDTPEGDLKTADFLEGVPEGFRGSDFEDDYELYIQKSLKNNKYPKDFNEWLSERPKPGGIMAIFDQLKLMMARSGLGKLISDFLGEDNWLTNIFGGKKEEEEKSDDFKKQTRYTNPKAYEYGKNQMNREELEDPAKWEDVQISGIEMKEDGKPNLSSFTPDKLVILKDVLESDNCTFAKTKDLTLDELVWIKDNVTTRAEDSFTVTNGDDTNTFAYTPEGIIAAKECIKEISIEGQIGLEYVDYFSEGFALPDKAFTDTENKEFATLQPALKSILRPEMKKFWKEGYHLEVDKFLRNMDDGITSQGAFDNSEEAFEQESDDSFQVNGSGWFTDDSYSSVENFMKSLK